MEWEAQRRKVTVLKIYEINTTLKLMKMGRLKNLSVCQRAA